MKVTLEMKDPTTKEIAELQADYATGGIESPDLSFHDFAKINISRCRRWHDPESWSLADWAVAAAGELGEACNAIKKLKRIEQDITNISEAPERQISTLEKAKRQIGEEIADTVIYLDLLAQRIGVDLATEIRAKFNKTSRLYNFPERL